ncbi:DUF6880 family protein [Roseomonas sp. WA12]
MPHRYVDHQPSAALHPVHPAQQAVQPQRRRHVQQQPRRQGVALPFPVIATQPSNTRVRRIISAWLFVSSSPGLRLLPPPEGRSQLPSLTATLLRRAMIDAKLCAALSSRYKHATRHFHDCRDIAVHVEDFASVPDRLANAQAFRTTPGRTVGF